MRYQYRRAIGIRGLNLSSSQALLKWEIDAKRFSNVMFGLAMVPKMISFPNLFSALTCTKDMVANFESNGSWIVKL